MRLFVRILLIAVVAFGAVYMALPLGGDKTTSAFLESYNNIGTSNSTSKQSFKEMYSTLLSDSEDSEGSSSSLYANTPPEASKEYVDAWVAFTKASTLSDKRKKTVLESLDTIKKGCIYHQLRSNSTKPTRCMSGCDGQTNGQAYNFSTQADYRVEDPIYLDCSYFAKHCWHFGGVVTSSANTSGYMSELKQIEFEELIPGDAVIRRSNGYGHIRIYIGRLSDGRYAFTEMVNHKDDGVIRAYTKDEMVAGGYTARRAPDLLGDTVYELPKLSGNGDSAVSDTYSNVQKIALDNNWQYANESVIKTGQAIFYKASGNRKEKIVAVNAGHGCSGADGKQTKSHPDGTGKYTGGTNSVGAIMSSAISSGTTFLDGTPEADVTLKVAVATKNALLADGYDVLMIRESDDQQLDNIARTVIANNVADAHISIHFDSTTSDSGAFYMKVVDNVSYKNMEPVKTWWKEHDRLGEALLSGLSKNGVKIKSSKSLESDLTQTSYSTIPSVDIEVGDRATPHSDADCERIGKGLSDGVNVFFN